ncbi:MAG: methyl-accepting chemotaxis protein [Cyanobacteriota bacterium]
MFIALTIPLFALLYINFSEKNVQIRFAEDEFDGNKYLVHLYSAANNIALHKSRQHRIRAGKINPKDIVDIQTKIDRSLNDLVDLEKELKGKFVQSDKASLELKNMWKDLKAKQGAITDIEESQKANDAVLDKIISTIREIGAESNLVLDPDLDTYYLMSNTIIQGSSFAVNLGKLQNTLEEISLEKEIALNQRTAAVVYTGSVTSILDDIKYGYQRVFVGTANKSIKSSLVPLITILDITTKSLSDFAIKVGLSQEDKVNINLNQVVNISTKSIEAANNLFSSSLKFENGLLTERISRFNKEKYNTLFYALFFVILFIALGLYVVLAIVRNIRTLEKSAEDFASGNFAAKANISTKDELGNLGNSFNKMTEQISELLQETEVAREEALGNNLNLESLIKETTISVSKIKESSEIVSDNAKIVAEAATLSLDVASEGEVAVSESIEGVEKIKAQIEFVANKILELSTRTQEISKIISSVNDIAVQSKFLAFNASIEASKAGEYGKGFSLVANEIKNLSEESKNATKRIAGILNEIQNMTNDSVILTEEATKLADSGLTLSKFAGETFEKLSDSIQNSSEAAYQISSSAIEQKSSMETLENSMKSFTF